MSRGLVGLAYANRGEGGFVRGRGGGGMTEEVCPKPADSPF
jgi:hypothetical protein